MAELPLVGDEFAGYRLISVLGRGGMSVVFRAENPRLGNVIALKVLDPSLANDDVFRTRFLEESRLAASMNHPNVIPIHDMGSSDGLLYIAMRCVTGTDMRQMLKKRGRLQPDTAILLLSQAARALDAAHRRGLVHRDVKPGNLLVEQANEDSDPDHLYLADFGITKHLSGRTGLTSSGQFLGTIDYVAPEQIRGISVLGLADQYALGCVLYECLTGRVPFEKDLDAAIIWAHVEESPTMPTVLRPDLPPAIDEVFARVLAKRPGDRYETCRDFVNAAREALGPMAGLPGASGSLAMLARPGSAAYPPVHAYPPALPVPEPQAHPAELAHERDDVYEYERGGVYDAPTTGIPAAQTGAGQFGAAPPPPGLQRPPRTPTGPGHRVGRRRRRGVPGWLLAGVALVVVVAGTAAGVTLALTRGHGGQAAGTPANSAISSAATRTGAAEVTASAPSLAVPTVAGAIPAGQTPSYIQIAPNGKFAYVTDLGADAITVLNTATDKVTGTIPIPQGPPQSVSFSPDSRTAYVSVYNPSNRGVQVHLIAFVDTAARKVTFTVPVNNFTPGPSATSPDGRFLYVPNHNLVRTGTDENVVDVIDLASRTLISTIPVPANPHWVVFDKKNGQIYISDHLSTFVTVLNASNNKLIKNIEVGETPHAEALSPDGSRLAVTSFDGNVVYLIDTATDKEIKVIPVGGNPQGIAYSPDGRYLFTVNNASNSVTVIDTADNIPIANIPTGKSPSSISVLPNGRQAYVADENDSTVEILNLPK